MMRGHEAAVRDRLAPEPRDTGFVSIRILPVRRSRRPEHVDPGRRHRVAGPMIGGDEEWHQNDAEPEPLLLRGFDARLSICPALCVAGSSHVRADRIS